LNYELLAPEKKVDVVREDLEEGDKINGDNYKGQIVYYREEELMRREEYKKNEGKDDADKEIATLAKVN
jgi:hypothetical protein